MNPCDRDSVRNLIGASIQPVRFDVREFDVTTSPRIDLDAFANARWRAANPVPADVVCWDCFTILAEQALQTQAEAATEAARASDTRTHAERVVGDFWCSGMDARVIDAQGIEPLRGELTHIDALVTSEAVATYLCDRHARGWGVLFGFEVAPDFDAPATTIACIVQGGLGLPDRDSYFDTTARGGETLAAYRAHVAAMLALGDMWTPEARALADAVVSFETRLASASLSRQTLARDIGQRYRRITVDAADRQHPMFSWSRFFTAQGISPPRHFSLAMPDFHAEVNAMLHEVPVAYWRAYLRFHAIDDMAMHLDDATTTLRHRFHDEFLRGLHAMAPRWKRVLHVIDAHIGEAMGELHVARTFSPDARRAVEMLVTRLRAAFHNRIERLDWMGGQTRAQALRKLATMRVKIGFPEHWRDWSELHTSARGWCANILAARAFNHRWMIGKLDHPVDASAWPMLPQTVNAGYDPQRNEIVFPAAILQPPFFDANADAALNFGGIGAVIAHEMTHGFDDQGSRFGADGRFENWWNDADRARFNACAKQLTEQFDMLPSTTAGRVDGRLTLGENIADFGGIAIAYDALQDELTSKGDDDPMLDGYTQNQRFFLNWAVIWRQNLTPAEHQRRLRADPHAPARLRATAAPSNMTAYAETFGCEPGDAMARAASGRIHIW